MTLLNVQNLRVHYGGVAAVKGVSLCVNKGEAVVLIGANGMGKSSVLRALLGLVPSTCDSLLFHGGDIGQFDTRQRVIVGLSLVPESRELFPKMTVVDNLRLGMLLSKKRAEACDKLDYVFELFPMLKERLGQRAGTLSGGEQQMLAISRALMQSPELLCLDEPSLGLAPKLVDDLFNALHVIRQQGTALLLVEQQARKALSFGDRGYVMSVGEIVKEGSCHELAEDPMVRSGYLGE